LAHHTTGLNMCDRCGCNRAFDEYGDRICWCDACWRRGCKAACDGEMSDQSSDVDSVYSMATLPLNDHLFEAFPLLVRFHPFLPTLASLCRKVRACLTLNKPRVLLELFGAQEPTAMQEAFAGACAARDAPMVGQFIQECESLVTCCVIISKSTPIFCEVEVDNGLWGPELVHDEVGMKTELVKTTPVALAIKVNDVTTVQLLLNARAAIHGIVRERNVAYRYWCDRFRHERHIDSAMRLALRSKSMLVADFLLQMKADLNRMQKICESHEPGFQSSEYATPLSLAIKAGAQDMMRFLIEKGASVEGIQSLDCTENHGDEDGDYGVRLRESQTALVQALLAAELGIVRDLLRHGVGTCGDQRVLQRTRYVLREEEDTEDHGIGIITTFPCLVKHDIDSKKFVQSPLSASLESKHINAVTLLLQANVSVNGTQYSGGREYASPLLIAMAGIPFMAEAADPRLGFMEEPLPNDKMPEMELTSQRLVKLLLDHRAAVNGIQGSFGRTTYSPLTAALRVTRCYEFQVKTEKSVAIWSLLKEAGAVDGFTEEGDRREGIVVQRATVEVQESRKQRRRDKHVRRSLLRTARRLEETVRESAWETDDSLE